MITALRHAVLLLFVAISVYPALNVLSISLRPGNRLRSTDLAIIPHDWTLDELRAALHRAAVPCAGSAIRSSWRRWSRSRASRWPRSAATPSADSASSAGEATMLAILTTQMFPATMLLLPLYILIAKLHLVDTYLGLMVFYTSTALPFCVWQMKGFYDTIPASLEEAARIDGCSQATAFWSVILPLATPGLVITALFSFMTAWSEYIVAAQVMQDEDMFTLPLGIKSFQASMSTQWGLYAAASILVSIPVVIVFLMLSKYLVSGLTLGCVKE